MPTVKDIVIKKPSDAEANTCRAWPIWTCQPSEFDWDYTQSQTCLILDGEVTVADRPETGQSVSFGPGDLVTFPVGLKCVWKVIQPVKKHYNFS